jgi:hypothetical protein
MRWRIAVKILVFVTAVTAAIAVISPPALLTTAAAVFLPKPDLAPTPAHEVVLAKYKEVLRPGITRKEVEDYLRAQKTTFTQTCCDNAAFSTMVRIGERPKPWFCSSWGVYVAFQFTSTEPDRYPIRPASDSDVLGDVKLEGLGETCL